MRELQRAYDNEISELKRNLAASEKKFAGVSRRDTNSVNSNVSIRLSVILRRAGEGERHVTNGQRV